MSNVISFEVVENTAVITFNNPPVNALGHAVRSGIVDALDKANNNVNVKAIILIGFGGSKNDFLAIAFGETCLKHFRLKDLLC